MCCAWVGFTGANKVDGGCVKSRLRIARASGPLCLAACTLCFTSIGLIAQGTVAPVEAAVSDGAGAPVPEGSLVVDVLNTAVINIASANSQRMRHPKVPGRNV